VFAKVVASRIMSYNTKIYISNELNMHLTLPYLTGKACYLLALKPPMDIIMPPPLIGGGIKRCICLTSVAYIGPKLRTETPRKTKIGTEVAHVTRDSDIAFKVKGQGHRAASLTAALSRQLQRSARERIGRGKLLLRCGVLGGARRFGAHGGRRGAGHIVAAARLQLVLLRLSAKTDTVFFRFFVC